MDKNNDEPEDRGPLGLTSGQDPSLLDLSKSKLKIAMKESSKNQVVESHL